MLTEQMIAKEDVSRLHFPFEDVLFTKDEQINRKLNLSRALSLGNLDHEKVRIVFQDIEGTKVVETTVWGVTDREVILKRGTIIPIRRILSVQLI